MKKTFVLLIITIMLLSACQKTPEEEVVVGKGDDNLESIIRSTPAPTMNTKDTEQNETWQEKLDGKNVTVNIDAKIEFPQVAQLPVAEVKYLYLTEDDAWKAIQVFFRDAAVYDKPLFTKEALMAQIVSLKKRLSEIENGTMPDYEEGDDEKIKKDIEYYTQLMQTAPSEDDAPQAIGDLSFEEKNGREVIEVSANIGNNGSPATLMIARDEAAYGSTIYFSNCPDSLKKTATSENNMEMTLEQAVSLAQNTMSELGIEDMVLNKSGIVGSPQEQAFELNFIKSVNGIGIADYTTHMMNQQEGEASIVAPFLGPEKVNTYINDSGVLQFTMSGGIEMGDIINDNVNVLGIGEVKDIFTEQVFYNYYASEERPLAINVERIELGYFIQSIKDHPGFFRAIPVWDFLATEVAFEGDSYTYSVLTINAIDGSIIDRSLGY